ncbi:MAG: AAA family ATPase [bacterium]|nr:AAA family ATPase [bacterium]
MSTTTAKKNGNGHTSEILDRLPPCDPEAERGVLSSIITDPPRFEEALDLRPADFYEDRNQRIFAQLMTLRQRGAIDATLLIAGLQESGDLELIGGVAYLHEVIEAEAVPNHCSHYAEIVKDRALKRAMIRTATETLRLGYADQGTAQELLSQQRVAIERLEDGVTVVDRFPVVTAAELSVQQIETPYLVDGILAANQPCILAGPKKAGKTSLAIDLGVALSVGGFFLGKFKVPTATRTAIMSGESGMATIQDTIRRVADAADRFPADLDNLLITEALPIIGEPDDMFALEKFLTGNEILALMIDCSYLAMPGDDTGNLHVVGGRLRSMNEVCNRTGCTLILLHHTTKNLKGVDPFDPPELEHIAWAGYQEWARQWLLIGRRERYEPGSGLHRLWLTAGGSAGHSGRWGVDIDEGQFNGPGSRIWDVEVVPVHEVRAESRDREQDAKQAKRDADVEARTEADAKRIVRVLAKQPHGETKSYVKDASGVQGNRLALAIAYLLESGQIVQCQVVKPNRSTPYEAYKLAEG